MEEFWIRDLSVLVFAFLFPTVAISVLVLGLLHA